MKLVFQKYGNSSNEIANKSKNEIEKDFLNTLKTWEEIKMHWS